MEYLVSAERLHGYITRIFKGIILVVVLGWSFSGYADVVDFSSNFQTVVVMHPVSFAAQTTLDPPLIYQWSFPGGNPAVSNNANPVVTYNTAGHYDVSLTISSQGIPYVATKTQYIHIIQQSEFVDLTGNENNHWYFLEQNVMSFNPGNQTTAISQGQVIYNNFEGAATISNNDGNLLFYGTPTVLYDRHHHIMQNGNNLFGGISSTMGILIVPQPANFQGNGINQNFGIYYVFTTDYSGLNHGLSYSVVDMGLNGGLGAVKAGSKNIFIGIGV